MVATLFPSAISGTITVPASKSAMQRACALALLNKGKVFIHNPGKSNDDLTAINIIKDLGVEIHLTDKILAIESTGNIKQDVGEINCGESGLSLRMFAPIAALSYLPVLLKGEGSLLNRQMHFIDDILSLLNVATESYNGYLPIKIQGPLFPKDIQVNGSHSSQYLTGLLFAFAKAAKEPIVIKVTDLKSKPYIDLSLQMLTHFGYKVRHDGYKLFYIEPVAPTEKEIHYHTEGDWSGASFLLVAGAVAGKITLKGLQADSVQADKEIINVLQSCGADIQLNDHVVSVTNANKLMAFRFDATDCPDLFPPLVSLAANCIGVSVIYGASRLAFKESNRAETLVEAFAKMGVEIIVKNDEMIISGSGGIKAASVSSYNDHRIAMACAIAALNANGPLVIEHAEAVNKSYPDFFDHLKMIGVTVSLQQE